MEIDLALSVLAALVVGVAVGFYLRHRQCENLIAEKSEFATQIKQHELQIAEQHAQLEVKVAQLQDQQEKSAELDKDISVLRANLAKEHEDKAKSQAAISVLQEKLESLQMEAKELAKNEAALVSQTDQLKEQLEIKIGEHTRLNQVTEELRQKNLNLTSANATLSTSQKERDESFQQQLKQFEEQKKQLAHEFENLAHKIFEEKGKALSHDNQKTMDLLLKPFREQISEFRQRVDTIHKESNESSANMNAQLEQLKNLNQQITQDAQNLTKALTGDKKLTGIWGEIQLEKTLQYAGLVQNDHYTREDSMRDEEGKLNRPDFVIKLPERKHIIIDSKASLVNYEKAITAEKEEQANLAMNAHVASVKKHIDELSKKNYSELIGVKSPDFVLMFMPIEAAYIEAMKHNQELFNYGYQKKVILVSHTTLMPILRTVANLWSIEQSNKNTREIAKRAGDIFNQVLILSERLQKLGNSMRVSSNYYNDTIKALAGKQGLRGKVERFSELSNKVTKSLPELEEMHLDYETDRLDVTPVLTSQEGDAN